MDSVPSRIVDIMAERANAYHLMLWDALRTERVTLPENSPDSQFCGPKRIHRVLAVDNFANQLRRSDTISCMDG